MRGRFITFEGGEGTGKSTQSALLSSMLVKEGIPNVVTREPGGTPNAEAIRSLLVNGDFDRWNAFSELCLINAARADHIDRVILNALNQGNWVICDRFIDSTIVYQGYAKGIDTSVIEMMHNSMCEGLWPDLTIVIDVPPDQARLRIQKRSGSEDRFERHPGMFHERVRNGFKSLAETGGRYTLVDGLGEPDIVAQKILEIVEPDILAWKNNPEVM